MSQYSAHIDAGLKILAHYIFVCFKNCFSYSSSFPVKMLATDAKTEKMEPNPKKSMTDKSFGGSA